MNTPLLERTGKKRLPPKAILWTAAALALALALGLALAALLKTRLPYGADQYHQALETEDDDRVLEIYHALRSKRASFPDMKQTDRIKALDLEAAALIKEIEQDAGQKSSRLMASILEGAWLTDGDIEWMERFAPVAGRQMTATAADAVESYLTGVIEDDKFLHFAGQMTRIPHLARDFTPLQEEFETVSQVRKMLAQADEALAQAAYYDEIKTVRKIMDGTDLSGLTSLSDYLAQRLDRAWQDYFSEQILLIRQEMALQRTYDASLRIERLLDYFPQDPELLAFQAVCSEKNPEPVVTWWDPVEHLAVRPLVADAGRAFDGDLYQAAADQSLLLVSEFAGILEQLYEGGYVLVDSRSFVTGESGLRGIPCPRGKKPLVIVLEDFYCSLPRAESGLAWRLDLNEKGQVEGVLLHRDGSEESDRSYSAIGILEDFIEGHPDFSFNGATGVIALVGQYGIFGYPVADVQDLALRRDAAGMGADIPELPPADFTANRQKVEAIVTALISRNWSMASGTYSRLSLPFVYMEEIEKDLAMTAMWVEPFTGELTALYCPFGDHIEGNPQKTKLYTGAGYKLQSGYGTWAYWHGGDGYVYVSRTQLSGTALRQASSVNLKRFFDPAKVLDKRSRP